MTERKFTYWLNDAKLMIEVPVADAVRRAQTVRLRRGPH
jgi:hypothetical protein